jgi:glycosyltransferase involved in cell wall biosynthesis
MHMAKIDVVIPCYNYGRFLGDCLRSVLEQSVRDLRVLIIDDASSDESAATAKQLAAGEPRVSVISHAKNQGHIATYNEGIAWAASDYFFILSADDLLVPGALERATTLMDSNPDVVLSYGKCVEWRDNSPRPKLELERDTGWSRQDLIGDMCEYGGRPHPHIPLCTPTAVVRTAVQKAVGGYTASLTHTADTEMWMRLAANGAVARLDAVQAIYRRHSANMSTAYFDHGVADFRQRKDAFDRFFEEYRGRIPGARRLHARATRSIAEKAFWNGIIQALRGRFESGKHLLRYSYSLEPGLRHRPPFRRAPAVLADVASRLRARATRALLRTGRAAVWR